MNMLNNPFTHDESEIIDIFRTDSTTREMLVFELTRVIPFIDEPELVESTQSIINRLETLTDEEYMQIFIH